MTLAWQDGIPYSSHFADVYFSADSGLAEKRHVFLQGNGLDERFSTLNTGDSCRVAETGFGTGLNFLCAWQLFEQRAPTHSSLDFFSIEAFPLSENDLQAALALWPALSGYANELLKAWRRRVPGWNRWSFAHNTVRLTLAICDVAEALPQLAPNSIDAWFLDGFSPAKNPTMWSDEVLSAVAQASHSTTTLATYTSAGWVRRGLQQAGFNVEKCAGFGYKREMLRATRLPNAPARQFQRGPQSAIVIGGGLAGCAVAQALAQRGIKVTLYESAAQLANGASGNPRGILHARFGVGHDPLHRFVLTSYGHALHWLDRLLPVDGKARSECGLLQLACTPKESKRIDRLAQREWPEHLLQFVDATLGSARAGLTMNYGGVWFPAAGWVVPPALCAALLNDTRIRTQLNHHVDTLTQTEAGWCVAGHTEQQPIWQAMAEVVVVCNAHAARQLAPFAHTPLITVRGQISLIPATLNSSALSAVVCGEGYCAPAVQGAHVIGASHTFDDVSLRVRNADHSSNLAKLASCAPTLRESLGVVDTHALTGRAALRCSAPGSRPLIGQVQTGLYCSLAHGTRGLISTGIAAEIIAAKLCGQLAPLPQDILTALAPNMQLST